MPRAVSVEAPIGHKASAAAADRPVRTAAWRKRLPRHGGKLSFAPGVTPRDGGMGIQSGGTLMSSIAAYGSLSAVDHGRQLRKAVIAATVGTTIEWYDFFLYGTAA